MNVIKHYVVGEKVFVYEQEYKEEYKGMLPSNHLINEKLSIVEEPKKVDSGFYSQTWEDTVKATYFGRSQFGGLISWLNRVEIEYDPVTEQVNHLLISSHDEGNAKSKSFNRRWSNDVDPKTLEAILSEAKGLFLSKKEMLSRMVPNKVLAEPDRDDTALAKAHLVRLRNS
jgi:hypothetical protein